MDLTIRTQTFGGDDLSWLDSDHGTDATDSVSITVSGTEVTKYGDTLPSGTLIGETGKVDPDGAGGTDTVKVRGFLARSIDISRGAGTYTGAVQWHGQVNDTRRKALPGFVALTADQKADLTHFDIRP